MQAGAPNSGAPIGNGNALTHGNFTRQAKEDRREISEILKAGRALVSQMFPEDE